MKSFFKTLSIALLSAFCSIFIYDQFFQTGKNTNTKETYGHSVIISPDGKILKLKKNGKGVIYAKINPKDSLSLRKIIPSLIN